MASAVLTPRVRMMAICDRVREIKEEPGVFNLKGVRQEITTEEFPFVPSELWLFMLLSSPRSGEYPGYVRVVHERTDKAVFFAKLEPRPSFETNQFVLPGMLRIRCSFPEEGWYRVEIWFFQEQGNDVLKGELPFLMGNKT